MIVIYALAILIGTISLISSAVIGAAGVVVGILLIACGAFMIYRTVRKKPAQIKKFVRSHESKAFHRPSCKTVRMIDKANLQIYEGQTAAYLKSIGLKPCTKCKPR